MEKGRGNKQVQVLKTRLKLFCRILKQLYFLEQLYKAYSLVSNLPTATGKIPSSHATSLDIIYSIVNEAMIFHFSLSILDINAQTQPCFSLPISMTHDVLIIK